MFDPFKSYELKIGQFAWSTSERYGTLVLKESDGDTAELRGAQAELTGYVNGVPQSQLGLYSETGVFQLDAALSEEELDYLADRINAHLDAIRVRGGSDVDG